MLRECVRLSYEKQRVVVFIEPIALYMTKDLVEKGDNQWLFKYPDDDKTLGLGELGISGDANDVVILSYGNGYYLSRKAQHILQKQHDINCKVIDLRWLAPLNETAIIKQVKLAKQVVIVDECRKTGSISEALTSLLVENLKPLPRIDRITGCDTFIPLGHAWQTVLPSVQDIITTITREQHG